MSSCGRPIMLHSGHSWENMGPLVLTYSINQTGPIRHHQPYPGMCPSLLTDKLALSGPQTQNSRFPCFRKVLVWLERKGERERARERERHREIRVSLETCESSNAADITSRWANHSLSLQRRTPTSHPLLCNAHTNTDTHMPMATHTHTHTQA